MYIKRTVTQLKTNFETTLNHKFYALCYVALAIMLSLTVNAQPNSCPEGDPLEWDWMQDLITNNSCVGDVIKRIYQFEYNGNDYYSVYKGSCDEYVDDDYYYVYYDCQGTIVCYVERYSPTSDSSCDSEIRSAG